MALQSTILRCLEDSVISGDGQMLKDAYSAISMNLASQTIENRIGLETLVECAEAALKIQNLEIAKKCLESYMLEIKRYNAKLTQVEICNQYLCRAHFAVGLLVSEQSKTLKGQPLIDGTLESIKHVMKGLDIATSNSRYLFLVYNGSVHHWHVARPLQRPEMRKYLLPSMEKVMNALEKVPMQEEWKVRNLISLALCQSEGGRPDEGQKTLQRAYDLASQANLGEIRQRVAILQVHLQHEGGAPVGGAGKAPAAKAPAAAAKKGAAAGAGAASLVPGGPIEEEAALRLIQAVFTGKPDQAMAQQQLKEAVAKVDPNPEGSAKGVNLGPVARAAWVAAVLGLPELAEKWASRAAVSQDMKTRIWSDMTRVMRGLQAVEPEKLRNVDPQAMQAHVKAMEQLEDIVNTFSKLRDIEGVHEASRLIWNTSMPLMQPDWRRYNKRALNSAARALEVISSPSHRLRAQLHLEAAKCDAAEDSLIKASQEVTKALALDYVATPEEKARFQLEHPLDRYLEPLNTSLALRASLTLEPGNSEEEAVLLIERSKESRNPAIKRDLLMRALSKLGDLPLLQPPAADYKGVDRPAMQIGCRRRCVIWAELIRSASAGKMEDIVRTAAPYCLHAAWTPEVDREMVLLQAQITYLEAEACVSALQAQRKEVIPPLEDVEAAFDGRKLRLPSSDGAQLQSLFLKAVLRGMQAGLSIKEPWLVINGAALLWNTCLSVMHQHRYTELLKALEPSVELLLQLPAGDTDGHLVCGMAEAYAKAVEHNMLLNILASDAAAAALAEYEADDQSGPAPPPAPPPGGNAFRYMETPGYEVLPVARVKTGAMDVRNHPVAAPIISTVFPKACKTCESALSRAGNAQSQSLYESYAKLQQLRGLATAIPAGTAAASEATSKVVGIIEGLLRSDTASARQQAAAAGTKVPAGSLPPAVRSDIKTAMQILAGLPTVNVELWAKLARAAAAVGAWGPALECSKSAAAAVPPDGDLTFIRRPSDLPELSTNTWFWLAIAELVHGQAILELVSATSQDQVTQLTLRQAALSHLTVSARIASFLKKGDLAEAAARDAWNAALPFMFKPLLRCSILSSFSVITHSVNTLGAEDKQFQVNLNCLLLECLASARKWSEGLTALEHATKHIADKRLHRPLLTWKVVCLANIAAAGGGAGGRAAAAATAAASIGSNSTTPHHSFSQSTNMMVQPASAGVSSHVAANAQGIVQAEMFKIKEYIPEYQGHTWAVLAHHSTFRYDQMEALQKGVDVVKKQPWVKTFYLAEYAEWLISTGMNDNETVEDVLMLAADTIMEFDMGEEDGEVDESEEQLDDEFNPYAADARRDRLKRKKKKRLNINAGEATLDPNKPPAKLTATLLERFVRIFVMLSQVANTADDLVDYLLTGHHYAQRMLTSAIIAAYTIPQEEKYEMMRQGITPPPLPVLPDNLAGWAAFDLSEEMFKKLKSDSSVLALSRASLPEAELSAAYIELLIRSLQKRGLDVHVLPLFHLLRMVARLAICNEGMYQAATLGLVQAMDTLGLSAEASRLELTLGSYWVLTQDERKEAKEKQELHELLTAATSRLGRSRAQPSAGRLSFLNGRYSGSGAAMATKQLRTDSMLARSNVPMASIVEEAVVGEGAEAALPVTVPVPAWLEDAGRLMNGVGLDSGGLLTGVRNLMVLRPWTLHETWLRKGSHLMSRGHYAAARELLLRAHNHARHCSDAEAEARALLSLSRCESMANNFEASIHLLQAAQQIGGDYEFWQNSITTYADCRLAAPHTTTTDVKEALQGGIVMFTTIARDDRAAEKEASISGAAIKTHLSKLLLHDMVTMRTQGIFNWKKHYDVAVTLCNQAIAALAAREAGVPQIEALLHQAKLLMEEPAPAKDIRPRFKRIEKALVQAEEMAAKFVQVAVPRDLPPQITLPVSLLVGRARLALAELRLMQAKARDFHAGEDREKARPPFPRVVGEEEEKAPAKSKGKEGEQEQTEKVPEAPANKSVIDEAVIVDFIDEMDEALPAFQPSLLPEDMGLTLAESAAGMKNAFVRVKGLLLSGQCHLYKYLTSAPESEHPWPEQLSAKLQVQRRRRRRRYREKLAAQQKKEEEGSQGVDAAPSADAVDEAVGGASGDQQTAGQESDSEEEDGGQDTEMEDPPLDAEEQAALEAQIVLARSLHHQCEGTLKEALAVAMGQKDFGGAEVASLELARCHGRVRPILAARYLCLASSSRGILDMKNLYLEAAPNHQPEALAVRQAAHLHELLPQATSSHHYTQVLAALATSGVSNALLDMGPDPSIAEACVNSIPTGTRVLLLYASPDRQTLYFAALNVPDNESTYAAAMAAALAPPAKATKGASTEPVAPPATKCIIDVVPLDMAEVERVRLMYRAYTRDAEKRIRESIATAAANGWKEPGQEAAEAPAKGKGKKAKAPAKPAKAPPKSGKGPTAASSDEGSGTEASADVGGKHTTPQAVFPPHLNDVWKECVNSMQQLLEPLMPAIRQALPELSKPMDIITASAAAAAPVGKAAKKGEDTFKPLSGHKVLLVIDPELQTLPFEALPYLRTNCGSLSRCPTLYNLHVASKAAMQEISDPSSPPSFDVSSMKYIVDPKCEGSAPEDAKGPYSPALIPTFQSSMLEEFKEWKGLTGSPNRVIAEAELMQLAASATGVVFLGMGRFLSYIAPKTIASMDLRNCDIAILMGRVNNANAHQRQLYLDNRKSKAERQLESPIRASELLLLRGVKTVVTTAMATTVQCNCEMMRSIFTALQGGATVAEAVWSTMLSFKFELEHVANGLIVMGLPHMVANMQGGGSKGGKGAKAGGKK